MKCNGLEAIRNDTSAMFEGIKLQFERARTQFATKEEAQ